MDPLTYVADGIVRDFGALIVLIVALAAALSIPVMLSLVMNTRRTMRAVERIAAAADPAGELARRGDVGATTGVTTPAAASAR